ncbi:MAG: FtsX-like permease family protein [Acidobacteria bacterium]|nr:FtsX-like permease family protein [Acidobacteriota bacterium]
MGWGLILWRVLLRPLRREPARAGLTVLAVALGVAVTLAIDLAGEAAAGSFRSSVETLAGEADFEITAIGGVPEETVGALARLPLDLRVRARIEAAGFAPDGGFVNILGADFLEGADEAAAPAEGGMRRGALVSAAMGVAAAGEVRVRVGERTLAWPVAGVLPATAATRGVRLVLLDIADAQESVGRLGFVDRILIRGPRGMSPEQLEEALRGSLPDGVLLQPAGASTEENRKMLRAFRWNLRILSYIALIVGGFLIYNTISVSVVRRRADIGILRALGAGRAFVLGVFLAEALAIALVGSAAGVGLGRLLAEGSVAMIAGTVNALYVGSRPGAIVLTGPAVWLAASGGVVVALVAAWAPAREAAGVAPADAMGRGRKEYRERLRAGRLFGWSAALAAAAFALARLGPVDGKPFFGYGAALLAVAAGALAAPGLTRWGVRAAQAAAVQLAGIEGLLALRSLGATTRRTSVLVAALATAVAMMASVGIMVGSFRETMIVWLGDQLKADYFLARPGRSGTFDAALADRIAGLPEVAAVDRFRMYPISFRGLPSVLASGESRVVLTSGMTRFLDGDREDALDALPSCDCVIASEPFATKHGVRAGQTVELPLAGRMVRLRVLGVFYDYGNERGMLVMDRGRMLRHLPDTALTSLAIYAKPGSDPRAAIERLLAGAEVLLASNAELRRGAVTVFDRTFAITYALELVAILVAVMGVAGALLALVIDRRRELGLLRFLGASRGQVRKVILCEAGMIGLLANGAGLVLGVALALLLVFVINKQSFGWTIQFHWPVAALVSGLTVVYAATVAAAIYPGRVAARLNPIEVMHEE